MIHKCRPSCQIRRTTDDNPLSLWRYTAILKYNSFEQDSKS